MVEPAENGEVRSFTTSDGYRCHYRLYPVAGAPRGHVVCIHGIQSHGGWYVRSCARLSQAGYQVSFLDRRGSGLSTADRGDAPSFRRLLDDLAEFIQGQGGAPAPMVPVFLVAISWGGKLGVAFQRRHPGLVNGLALVCPGFYPQVKVPFRQRLTIAWARLVSPGRCFPIPLNDPELFTAQPQWQQFIREDPLALRQATARLLVESVRLDTFVQLAAADVRVPVLLLLAEHDRIIRNAPTRRLIESFPTTDRQVIEYPGAHHTLEFEPDADRFIGDLQHWLDRQAAAGLRGA